MFSRPLLITEMGQRNWVEFYEQWFYYLQGLQNKYCETVYSHAARGGYNCSKKWCISVALHTPVCDLWVKMMPRCGKKKSQRKANTQVDCHDLPPLLLSLSIIFSPSVPFYLTIYPLFSYSFSLFLSLGVRQTVKFQQTFAWGYLSSLISPLIPVQISSFQSWGYSAHSNCPFVIKNRLIRGSFSLSPPSGCLYMSQNNPLVCDDEKNLHFRFPYLQQNVQIISCNIFDNEQIVHYCHSNVSYY